MFNNNTDISKVTGTVEDFYRGYIEISEKGIPLHTYKKDEPGAHVSTIDQVKDKSGFGGVLADWAGFIEFKDAESSEIATKIVKESGLNLPVWKTENSCYIGFRNTNNGRDGEQIVTRYWEHVMLSCGLIADIKIGPNCKIPLVVNGKARELVNPVESDGTPVDLLEYDELPAFFLPAGPAIDDWGIDDAGNPVYKSKLIGMTEGAVCYSRLRDLFRRLRQRKMNVEDCRTSVDICNRYVFENTLSDEELEECGFFKYINNLLPKGAAEQKKDGEEPSRPEWQNEKGKLENLNILGNYIAEEKGLVLIGNAVHAPDALGIYKAKPKLIRKRALELQPDITVQQRDNLERHLLDACNDKDRGDCRYIAFENGVLDIETGVFNDNMPDATKGLYLTTMIPHKYNPDAPAVEVVDTFLNNISCNDSGIRDAIEQMIGAACYDCTTAGQIFFIPGQGGSGKTTLERVIKRFLGSENVLSRSLKELSQQFVAYELQNKKAVIGDDISDDYLSGVEEANIKKFFGGFSFSADRKFRDSIEIDNFATGIFSCNSMPTFSDKDSGAIDRRVVIIPLDAKFTPGSEGYDPRFSFKLESEEAMEYLGKLAIEGLKRYLKNGLMLDVDSDRMEQVRNNWLGDQQPLRGWFENARDYIAYRPVQRLLDDANEYLESYGRMKVTDKALTKFVKSQGYISKLVHWRNATYMWQNEKVLYGDKSVTIYVPKDDTSELPPAGAERPSTGFVKDEKGYDVPATAEDVPF